MAKRREEVPEETAKYREQERVKKHKQQHANKFVKETGIKKLNTPMKRKAILGHISKAILGHISLKLKHKVTCAMKVSPNVLKGFKMLLERCLGSLSPTCWKLQKRRNFLAQGDLNVL